MPDFTIRELYELLASQFQIDKWWPADHNFEIFVGAILTQNTTWTSVELALNNLKTAGILTADSTASAENMAAAALAQLVDLIRPAGSFNQKSIYLKNIATWYLANHRHATNLDTATLRKDLLAVKGIGPETADDILLYVYQRPVFIYDAYGRRLLEAAGFPTGRSYEQTRKLLTHEITEAGFSAAEHGRFHGLIVAAGKYARVNGWQAILASQLKPHPDAPE